MATLRRIESKAISSANAAKHGLLAEAIIISGEAAEHLAALSASFHAEFRPRTQTETHHVETMVMCRWRLHRVWEFEAACLNHEIEKLTAAVEGQKERTRGALAFRNLADQSRTLDVLARHEAELVRTFVHAHHALMELKSKPIPDWSDHEEHSVLITVNAEKNDILPNQPQPDPTLVL